MTASRTYLPWFRRGFATAVSGMPGPNQARAALPTTVALRGLTAPVAIPAELAGPGDVIGLEAAEIVRVEPADGSPDFQPAYFPYAELASPDLPWRFSPLGPSSRSIPLSANDPQLTAATTELKPWIALVVVPTDQLRLATAVGQLPVLVTTGEELPPADETWAWAHVQVVPGENQTLDEALADPSRRVTRLLCPRRLDAGTHYTACIVPTFAAGRRALLSEAPLAPSWTDSGPVELPVYHHWTFATAEAGSFETLARQLRPRPAPAAMNGKVLGTARPGWGAAEAPGRTTVSQGALRPVGSRETQADAALAESLALAISASGPGPQLLPPLYGQDYQGGLTAIPVGGTGWLPELNTDPRRRLAAGLGAWAVLVQQEDLVDDAWQQLAQVHPALPGGSHRELADVVADTLASRQVPNPLPSPTALRLGRRRATARSGTGGWGAHALTRARHRNRMAAGGPTDTGSQSFAPSFPRPAYEHLRAVSPEWLLPGVADIPQNSVVLVESNPQFVESFLVGLNHAMAQELLWRRYPLDRSATMFRSFWASAEETSIGDWTAQSTLGAHTAGGDELVLLLRGNLLRRFPTAVIHLARRGPDGSEQQLSPSLQGQISADCAFVGFPTTAAAVLAPTTDGAGPWSVVIQESVHQARFGVDDATADSGTPPAFWQDLDWAQPHLAGNKHVPVTGPLLGSTRPASRDSAETATWGLSSAHMAAVVQQSAFRVRIPVALWLS